MSFFGKIKQWLGIGGVKFELEVPAQAEKTSGLVSGKVHVTAKSEQTLNKIEVMVKEQWSMGRGEDKQTKTFDLGKTIVLETPFVVKPNEKKTFDFTVSFSLIKSENDRLKDSGGVVGGLGKLGSFMDGEKSEYTVEARGDVKGTAFGPNVSKNIKLV